MMFCCGASVLALWRSAALASGMPTTSNKQRDNRTRRAGCDQRAMASDHCHQRRHDGGRDGAAEETCEGMDRKGAAHARLIHVGRKDRIIGWMINAVGKSQQHCAGDQPGIAQMQAEHDQREAAHREAHQQDFAGADMIGQIADRRLRQAGCHGEDGQRKAEFDVADAEPYLQKGEQHRQHEYVEMADPMRRRNRGQGAQRFVSLRLLRCGENVDHF